MVILGKKKYQTLEDKIDELKQALTESKNENTALKKEIAVIKDKLAELEAILNNNIDEISNRKSAEKLIQEYFYGGEDEENGN